MNRDIKQQWITDLTSGQYRQGTGYLTQEYDGGEVVDCCLGVLCRQAVRAGVVDAYHRRGGRVAYGAAPGSAQTGMLPDVVA